MSALDPMTILGGIAIIGAVVSTVIGLAVLCRDEDGGDER